MIAAVYDCMIYVQAALSRRGAAYACLTLAEDKRVALFLCPAILNEIKETLDRPSFRRKYSKLTDERVSILLGRVAQLGNLSANPPHMFSLPRDPKDETYLNLAIMSQVPFLVSRDKDLLSLMDEAEFRKTYPGLTILEPGAFLDHVRTHMGQQKA